MIQLRDEDVFLAVLDDPHEPAREEIDAAELGELTDSLASNGLLQPIGARGPSPDGRFEVVWGHRRTLAARRLGWLSIRARVCEWATDPLEARTAENLHRVDLNPREEARVVGEYRARGKPFAEIARIMRRSVGWVQSRAELLTWPDELQSRVARGELAFAVARLLADVDHDGYRAELVAEAARTNANAATVTVWLAHYAVDKERIIRNHETIEDFVQRRETFTILATCDACRERVDSASTVLIRCCPSCVEGLREFQRQEEQERANGRRAGA